MPQSRRLLNVLALGAVFALLMVALGPVSTFGQPPTPDDQEVVARPSVTPKKFAPKDQPDPQMYQRRRRLEQAVLSGNQAEAQSLALTGEGKLLVLLVEYAGTDTITWEPGDTWDPYGVAQVVDASELGDCTNVITQTKTFTYGPTLHNQVPKPPSADAAYKGETSTFSFTMWSPDFSRQYFDDMVFGDGLSFSYTAENGDPVNINITESLRKYYENLSRGLYTVTGDVVGWIPLPHSKPFYGADLCPGNLSFQPISGAGSDGWYNNGQGVEGVDYGTPKTVIKQAVDWINANMPGFDWSKYDGNGDGQIDTIVVVTAGVSEANTGADENAIWPHSSSVNYCASPGPDGVCGTSDDIRTGAYIIQGETTGVSTFTHEFGHRLGADDLYAYGYGETSVGIWSNMSDDRGHGVPWDSGSIGMDPWHKLGWGWLNPVVVNYDDPPQEITLSQAADPAEGANDAILVHLPDQVEQIETTHSGTHMWWGGRQNLMNNLAYRPVDLSGATSAELTFWHKFDIEEAWDFGFVQVSTDNGATWTSLSNANTTSEHDPSAIEYVVDNLPGFTGYIDVWRQETFDLSAYAGQQIWLGFRYATDWATLGQGWWVDDIEVTANGATVFSDDVESGAGPWVAEPTDGWRISTGVFTYPHYYLAEWRNDAGIDHNLAIGRCDVQDWGMLVWYINDQKYTANEIYDNLEDPPSFGPKGKALVVDGHPQPLRDTTSEYAHNARSNISYRCYGVRDVAFGLRATAPFYVTQPPTNPTRWGNPNYEYPSEPAVTGFHDYLSYYPGLEYTNIRASNDPRGPVYYWAAKERDASVVVPATAPYSVMPPWYTGAGIVQWMYDLGAWYGFWYAPVGPDKPLDKAYGVNLQVVEEAPDLSSARIKFYNKVPKEIDLTPVMADMGYVDSRDRTRNYLGSGTLWTGMDTRPQTPRTIHGVFQVNLSQLPAGAKILDAEVEIMGKSDQYMDANGNGTWSLQLLDPSVDMLWRQLGYWQVHNAATMTTVRPVKQVPQVTDSDLAVGQWNRFMFEEDQLTGLQSRLDTTGRASFRLDGMPHFPYGRHIFGWDGSATNAPVVRIMYLEP
jgi:immune inhibitor A